MLLCAELSFDVFFISRNGIKIQKNVFAKPERSGGLSVVEAEEDEKRFSLGKKGGDQGFTVP
jgi:hypothetical protein